MMIRQEEKRDCHDIYAVVKAAFESADHSDGNEQDLVNALRQSGAYIPELSLVAEIDGRIAGHIMFTKVRIGSALIREGHKRAGELGYGYSIVLGSEAYYPKAGYVPAKNYGILSPFDVPDENFMACKLDKNAPDVSGAVQYPKEFGIE